MKGRLEIGRRLLKLVGSAPGFFSIGVIAAVLKDAGTVPDVREKWMMAEMRFLIELLTCEIHKTRKQTVLGLIFIVIVAGLLLHTPPKWLSLGPSDTGHG